MFTPRRSRYQELLRAPEGARLLNSERLSPLEIPNCHFAKLNEAAAHALKSVGGLFEHPINDSASL